MSFRAMNDTLAGRKNIQGGIQMKRMIIPLLSLVVLAIGSTPVFSAVYTVTDLGTLGGGAAQPSA
ncbi:MAG TPA: hypothetical protein VFG19_17805 [Geobacteraceae bacterium]|nr:hypothetical protein [Geobacteraceae bacterium]